MYIHMCVYIHTYTHNTIIQTHINASIYTNGLGYRIEGLGTAPSQGAAGSDVMVDYEAGPVRYRV
jgi:hypothetical protein